MVAGQALRLAGRYSLTTTPGEVAVYTLAGHEASGAATPPVRGKPGRA